MVAAYLTIPHKPIFFLSLAICLLSGAMTPLFSFLRLRLLFKLSTGADHVSIINMYGGIVRGISATDEFLLGFKYFLIEWVEMV
jgi:ATP-binding cassette, subfamily B (MDR/TAP), member 1